MLKVNTPEAVALIVQGITLQTSEVIKHDQDGIGETLTDLDKRVHDNFVQCLAHAAEFGDTSLMRRLLVEKLGELTGYRRQGLINAMRKFSPIEFKGKDALALTGLMDEATRARLIEQFPEINRDLLIVGERRPFLVAEANSVYFWLDADNAEQVSRPVFRDNLLSKIDSAAKEFRAAVANTSNIGTPEAAPIKADKPYWPGIHTDNVLDFFSKVEELKSALPTDDTKERVETKKEFDRIAAKMDRLAASA